MLPKKVIADDEISPFGRNDTFAPTLHHSSCYAIRPSPPVISSDSEKPAGEALARKVLDAFGLVTQDKRIFQSGCITCRIVGFFFAYRACMALPNFVSPPEME
jgi:hypothetical protein